VVHPVMSSSGLSLSLNLMISRLGTGDQQFKQFGRMPPRAAQPRLPVSCAESWRAWSRNDTIKTPDARGRSKACAKRRFGWLYSRRHVWRCLDRLDTGEGRQSGSKFDLTRLVATTGGSMSMLAERQEHHCRVRVLAPGQVGGDAPE